MQLRRILPATVLPIAILATALTGSVWLRTFPASTIAVPIFGAAVLSGLVAAASVSFTRRSLAVTAPISLVAFVVYALVIVLGEPFGFGDLIDGFRRGPARLISFALPLVSPSSLMVVPVALVWLVGAIAGEALTRRPTSWLPFPVWLIGLGVSYGATARTYLDGHSNRTADTLLGVGLLVVLAGLRLVQTWLRRTDGVIDAGPERALPIRSLVAGGAVALLAAAVASIGVQTATLGGSPRALQREPAVRQSAPLTPLAFVASLRPRSRTAPGVTLFTVNTDRSSLPYVTLASVDYYDGDSWTFQRSFKPSGGVIPADADPTLSGAAATVTQRYQIVDAALVRAPWMPYLARPAKVTGFPVDVEPTSAMIVPSGELATGDTYTVRSSVPVATVDTLGSTWLASTSPPPIDTQLPAAVRAPVAQAVTALADETGQASTSPAAFLTALVQDLRRNYALTDPSASATAAPTRRATPTGVAPTRTAVADVATGGTSVAAVLASVLGDARSGTPEQFATLVALVARSLGVPARVVSGFRLAAPGATLPAGNHTVTSAQAATWVEIPVRGAGWVVLDPAPTRYSDSAPASSVGAQTSQPPSTAPPTDNELITQTGGGQAIASKSSIPGSHGSSAAWLFWFVPAVVVGAIAVALFARFGIVTERRRRRRNAADPRGQVVGAWQESLELLSAAGLGDVRPLTGAEITTASETRFGMESAGAVAVLSTTADRALYSEHQSVGPEDADVAWRAHDSLRRSMRESVPWRDRVRAALGYRRRH